MNPSKQIEDAKKLEKAGDVNGAWNVYQAILIEHPGHAGALKRLGQLSAEAGKTDMAGRFYLQSLENDPNQADVWTSFGAILIEQNRPGDAEKALSNALILDPDHAPALFWRASLDMMHGQTELAFERLWKAIQADPELTETYPILAQAGGIPLDNPLVKKLEGMVGNPYASPAIQVDCNYGLAYVYEHAGDTERFFKHLDKANQAQRAQSGEWREAFSKGMENLKDAMEAGFLDKKAEDNRGAFTPIFIVGLPRSGSTLIEQMLASHSAVEGGGELPYFPRFLQKVAVERTGVFPPDAFAKMTQQNLAEVAHLYRTRVAQFIPKATFVTDKLPWNFQLVGLIAAVFPSAKVIDIRRNALDCGLSIYKNRFPVTLPHCCDHSDYAFYRRGYLDLMDFWDQLCPGFVHQVDYDNLVQNPEKELQSITRFCGFAFEPEMLEFYRNPRPVRTLSQRQVTKPLNTASIGVAKKYADFLDPLVQSLQEHKIPF